jgi:hypothetical protein
MAKSKRPPPITPKSVGDKRNSRATVSGPSRPSTSISSADDLAAKAAGAQELAANILFNANKSAEYDPDEATAPPAGITAMADDPIVGASTVTEMNGSDKVGSGGPTIGNNKTIGPLDRVRVDSTKQPLTTNQGVPTGDNQNSLKRVCEARPCWRLSSSARRSLTSIMSFEDCKNKTGDDQWLRLEHCTTPSSTNSVTHTMLKSS